MRLVLARASAVPDRGIRPVLPMHDGLLVQVPSGTMEASGRWLKELMEQALVQVCPGVVPLAKVDLLGERWGPPKAKLG